MILVLKCGHRLEAPSRVEADEPPGGVLEPRPMFLLTSPLLVTRRAPEPPVAGGGGALGEPKRYLLVTGGGRQP
jgi:hypothetical protein